MWPNSRPSTVRSTSLDDIGDRDAEPGSKAWARWYTLQAKKLRDDMSMEVRSLRDLLNHLEQFGAWRALGYASFSLYCARECNLTTDQLDAIRRADGHEVNGVVLGSHPGPAPGSMTKLARDTPIDSNGNNKCIVRGGNSETYLSARLARDRPDIKAQLDAGQFRSVRSAARAAGIVRPTATFYTDNPTDAARAILKHFQGDSLATLIRELQR